MPDIPPYLHAISLPTPFPVGPVNVYLAEGDPLTLVDTGPRFEPAREALHEGLSALGYRPSDLGCIILSHAHSDHCGLASELEASSGAAVLTHPANVAELSDYATQRSQRLAFYATLMMEAGVPQDELNRFSRVRQGYGQYAQVVHPKGALTDGTVVQLGGEDWQVLHTPGHTGGVICLFHPERRALLSSDHLLRDISSNPIVEPPEGDGGERPRRLIDYIAQLKRVSRLAVDYVLPGHGPPINDVPGLVARRLAFHEERVQQILATLQDGEQTVYQITLVLFPALDPLNRFLALSEVIGHLDVLERRAQALSRLNGHVRLWRAR
jgi:glyoxylase-like metal-dependent hydrolase (beta-lactamase superfamily II)